MTLLNISLNINPKPSLYWLLGISLTLGAPFFETGPSFVTFLSPQLVATVSLVGLALFSSTSWRAWPTLLGILFLVYVVVTALIIAVSYGYPLQYSGWVLSVFFIWVVVFIHLSCINRELRYKLLSGLTTGGCINICMIFLNLSGTNFLPYWMAMVSADHAGPWAHYLLGDAAEYSVHGAIGLFSFSRTASGYFLAMIYPLFVLKHNEDWRLFLIASVIYGAAIALTGSKLGFGVFILFFVVFFCRFVWRRPQFGILVGAVSLFVLSWLIAAIVPQEFIDRVLGISDDGYGATLEGRLERQQYFWVLDIWEYIFGVGAGSLSFRLGLDSEGFNLYGLHNSFFQFISNIGVVGTMLYVYFVGNLVKSWTGFSVLFGVTALIAGLGDDFFFPSTQGVAIPIILAVAILWVPSRDKNTSIQPRAYL